MNVSLYHHLVLALIVVCSVVLGASHVLKAEEISAIFLAATGSSFGNAVGSLRTHANQGVHDDKNGGE